MKKNKKNLRAIPAVSTFLNRQDFLELCSCFGRDNALSALRGVLSGQRAKNKVSELETTVKETENHLVRLSKPGIVRVINATGTLVHTNLGRSVSAKSVVEAVVVGLRGYSNLEFDLDTGKRGKRAVHVESRLNHLTGAENSLVCNNNAAALMLCINTFAMNKEVVVSRGELIEIGGSFRLPEIISQAGGILREVGTTNKTRLSDYEKAVNGNTGLLLKMHTSNYRVTGFVEETGIRELAALSKKKRVPVVHDVGSGLLAPAGTFGFENEPDLRDSLRKGACLVTLSGDKLLGGPQAGIVLGKRRHIEALKKNPMMRALRLGKISLLALEAALVPYLKPRQLASDIPLFAALSYGPEKLLSKARILASKIREAAPSLSAEVAEAPGSVGGGAMPGRDIASFAVILSHKSFSPSDLAARFRNAPTPVVGTFARNRFALNVLSLLPDEENEIIDSLKHIV